MLNFFSRLDNFMKYKGLNDNQITVEAGISNGIIGKARKRGSLSLENISKLLLTYPEMDADWLLTGRGEMLYNDTTRVNVGPCERCADKDTIISLLKEKVQDQKSKIDSLEKGSADKNSNYSQTG